MADNNDQENKVYVPNEDKAREARRARIEAAIAEADENDVKSDGFVGEVWELSHDAHRPRRRGEAA